MIKHPDLYSLDSKGKLRIWRIEQSKSHYWTVSGLIGGDKVISKPTQALGKNIGKSNETTPEEQASLEIESKYNLKIDKGYKYNLEEVGNIDFIKPMLAYKYGDVVFEYPVYTQPKLDGIRCIISKNGMFTRNGKQIYSAPHILEELKNVFDKHPNLVLDGELFSDRLKDNFNKIISLTKKVNPTDEELLESIDYIQYWIYDIVDVNTNFSGRYANIIQYITESFCIKIVPTFLVNSKSELDSLYGDFLTGGQEGQMIRVDGTYENKRSKFLLKRKEFSDDEFQIVDITEGKGNRSGMFGRAKLITNSGLEFEANARGNEEFYINLLKNKDSYIGKQATVRYQNITPDGVPRFGVIIEIRDYE